MTSTSPRPDAKDKAARTAMFTGAIQNMKTLAEGGKLAPR